MESIANGVQGTYWEGIFNGAVHPTKQQVTLRT